MKKSLLVVLVLMLSLTVYGCGSSDDTVTASGAAGTSTISMKGGVGTEAAGGSGNYLDVYSYGDVKLLSTGEVDTSFSLPSYGSPEAIFGTNPLTISSDTTLSVLNSAAAADWTGLAAGTPYLLNATNYIYVSNGTAHDPATAVTGLKVNAGVTLTLGLNRDSNDIWWAANNNGLDLAYLSFDNDMEILGTVVTNSVSTGTLNGLRTVDTRHGAAATDRDKGFLYIESNGGIILGPSGLIDTSGADATVAGDRGGDGGGVWLNAYGRGVFMSGQIHADGGDGLGTGIGGDATVHSIWTNDGVWVWSNGVLVNNGPITANGGGNGAVGGFAGYIDLEADQSVYNTADLTANGGNGSAGNGEDARYIYMYSYYASAFNSGDLTANGGNGGGTGSGGSGGSIRLYGGNSGYIGQIRNSGNLTANGGASGDIGFGGNGGYFYLESYGGDIRTSGAIAGNGGIANGTGMSGGLAAGMDIYAYSGTGNGYSEEKAPGAVKVAGDISLNGGDGPNGGGAGYVYVYNEDFSDVNLPPINTVEFVGYASADFSGGSGVTSGGNGGNSNIYTDSSWWGDSYHTYPTGAITSEIAITSLGGSADGDLGTGGSGGYIDWETNGFDYSAYWGTTVLKNFGAIDVSGGIANTAGGSSGGVYFYGHDKLENTGAITANGGDSGVFGGTGANFNIEFYATLDLLNTGAINAKGGSGTATNGSGAVGGSWIGMYAGGTTTNTGAIDGSGGNAGTGTGTPGDGGYIDLFSETTATVNAATINVAKGTGGTGTASNGTIAIDWTDFTPSDGVL